MHNLTTLLSGQYDQCILCHRLEIFEYMYCSISLYRGLCHQDIRYHPKMTMTIDPLKSCKIGNYFSKKDGKGGSGVSCYLFRHVSNHQRIYKKCSTKTRNVANALKHLYQSIFIKNIFNARPWSRFS